MSEPSKATVTNESGEKQPPKWRPHSEHVVAVVVILTLIGLWHWHLWTFGAAPPKPLSEQVNPGIAQYLLADPNVLALVELAIGALAAFLLISFAVHTFNRRWMRGLTSAGMSIDDPPVAKELEAARETINRLTARIRDLEKTGALYADALAQAQAEAEKKGVG